MKEFRTDLLTIRLRVDNKEQATPFWDSAANNTPIHGCVVRAMSWGDMFQEREALERRYQWLKELLQKEGCWDALDKVDRLERMFPIDRARWPEPEKKG